MTNLNFFKFYEKLAINHENNLTRNLLIILKHFPAILKDFLLLIKDKAGEQLKGQYPAPDQIEEIEYLMQIKKSEISYPVTLPVLLTEKKVVIKKAHEIKIETAASHQPDAVIFFKPFLGLAIEAKPYNNVSWEQVYGHLNIFFNKEMARYDAVNITWDEIINLINNYKLFFKNAFNKESFISGIEISMLDDYLEYLTECFPKLMPYDNPEICGNNIYACQKYIIKQLLELNMGEVEEASGSGKKGAALFFNEKKINFWLERACLLADNSLRTISFEFYPADTISQAIAFYDNCNMDKIKELIDNKWEVSCNLHFFHINQFILNTDKSILDIMDYIQYWKTHSNEIRQYKKNEISKLTELLLCRKMIDDETGKKIMEKYALYPKWQTINLIPGLRFEYQAPFAGARSRDKKREMPEQIKKHINDILDIVKLT